jgi:hypothetical protein
MTGTTCGRRCWRGRVTMMCVAVLPQTLAHTAMVVGAMTGHGDVVTWCIKATAARPWVVGTALLCSECCTAKGSITLLHVGICDDPKWHSGLRVRTSALLAACEVGDMALVRQLLQNHRRCRVRLRDGTMCDGVSVRQFRRRGCCCSCVPRLDGSAG